MIYKIILEKNQKLLNKDYLDKEEKIKNKYIYQIRKMIQKDWKVKQIKKKIKLKYLLIIKKQKQII